MSDLLTLADAAGLLGFPEASLRRRLNSTGPDRVHGVKVPKGRREVWMLPQAEVDRLRGLVEDERDYTTHEALWLERMLSGYYDGVPLSPDTARGCRYGIKAFWDCHGGTRDIRHLTPLVLREVLNGIPVEHFAKRDKVHYSVTSFIKYLSREGLRSETAIAECYSFRPRRKGDPRRTVLNREELFALLEANESLDGRTEFDVALGRVLLYLLALAGLRRGEAMRLMLEDVRIKDRGLWVRKGKGGKDRFVGLSDELIYEIRRWMLSRPKTEARNLLVMADGKPITESAIQNRMERLRRRAGGLDINTHGLRRTFATLHADAGTPLPHIQVSLGHNQITTTMGYIRNTEKEAAEAIRQFSLRPPKPQGAPGPQTRRDKLLSLEIRARLDRTSPERH